MRLRPHLDVIAQHLHLRCIRRDYEVQNILIVSVRAWVPDVEFGGLGEGGSRALERGERDVHEVLDFGLPVSGGEGGREPELGAAVPEEVVGDEVFAADEDELEVELGVCREEEKG